MHPIIKYATWTLIPFFLAGLCGCGGLGTMGGQIMEIPELGFSMNIPAGWRLENPQMCHKGDNTGLLMEEDLEGKTFEKRAGDISREFGNTVLSENALKISGQDAIKALVKTPAGDMLTRVYIRKGDKVIVVSFVIAKEDYPANEAALQQALQSMALK